MRTTDGAPLLTAAIPAQSLETSPASTVPLAALHPTPPPIALADRLKAVGLVVLTGTVGVGAVVLGRSLWLAKTEETLAPLESGRDRSQIAPLRDRLPIITPGSSSLSPPDSFLSSQPFLASQPSTLPKRSQRSSLTRLPRISHGFGTNESISAEAAPEESAEMADVASSEVMADSATASADFSNSESSLPEVLQDSEASADATPTEEPPPETTPIVPPSPASSPSKPTQSDAIGQDVISALLASPAPRNSVAIAPHSPLSKQPAPLLTTSASQSVSPPEKQPASPPSAIASQPLESIAAPISLPPAIAQPPLAPTPEISPPSPAPAVATSTPPILLPPDLTTAPPSTDSAVSSPVPAAPIATPPEVSTAPNTQTSSSSDLPPVTTTPAETSSPATNDSSAPATTALAIPPAIREGVYIDRIKISGNTRFSEQQLAEVVQKTVAASSASSASPSEGEGAIASAANSPPQPDPTVFKRQLPLTALVQASEAITKLYVEKGYINSGAYVPAEVLQGAAPEIRVVEGKIEKINIQKIKRPGFLWLARPLSASYVRRRLARSLRTPLQIDQLADSVQLLALGTKMSQAGQKCPLKGFTNRSTGRFCTAARARSAD